MSKLHVTLLGACLCLAPYSAMAQGAAKLTDPQIAHIAHTAGQIDIQAAELALKTVQQASQTTVSGRVGQHPKRRVGPPARICDRAGCS
jgi:putative membrane protein